MEEVLDGTLYVAGTVRYLEIQNNGINIAYIVKLIYDNQSMVNMQ